MSKKKLPKKYGRTTPPISKVARNSSYTNEGTATPKIGTTPQQLPPS